MLWVWVLQWLLMSYVLYVFHSFLSVCYGSDLEDLDHVLTVPLLSHVTQPGRDVDPPADVHVHLHGLLLNLTVQLRQVLTDPGRQGGEERNRES